MFAVCLDRHAELAVPLEHAPMETLTQHEPWQLERLRGWGRLGPACRLTAVPSVSPHPQ
jgi:hypothetical protein